MEVRAAVFGRRWTPMDDDDPSTKETPGQPAARAVQGSLLTVEIADRTGRLAPDALLWLRRTAPAALGPLGRRGEVRVAIVSDAEMAAAHDRFAGEAGTTDVLTFDLAEADGDLDADIFICLDEAARQGAERGHPPERELLLYIVHGVLHCLGHDDHDEGSARRMHRLEDDLLEAAGVGAVYDPAGRNAL